MSHEVRDTRYGICGMLYTVWGKFGDFSQQASVATVLSLIQYGI